MKFKLVQGVGNYSEGTACIMSAAVAYKRILDGVDIGEATDELDCVCPVIRAFLIRINDNAIWSDDLHRTNVLLPLIPRIVGTNNPKLLLKRMFFLVNWSVKIIAPLILRWQNFENRAEILESLKDIVDYESASAAGAAAAAVAYAAANAAYNVATAANAASYAAAAIATNATFYAAAVCSVDDVDDADLKEKIVVEVVKILDQLLNIR